ncbi:uncharacterized protein LOC100372984 [Saccoglossus kowalevskii]|uniref:Transmembrane protein 201-like n=1 Tax=Saccoglossus kowalevskii TaxID=10224 RepID=A0ABM0GV93_SACKO|nr:PREDICTED: transmembrane protein 201-like [Saccoglossus kowalevskii]
MLLTILTVMCTAVIGSLFIWLVFIRHPSHVKVNCWFCNEDTIVPYGNKNCWDCPHCEQYNGFNEDGDYNKPIPAQHLEELNHSILIESQQQNSSINHDSTTNLLCQQCNRNQLLKVRQLAVFVPRNEETFDEEIEVYEHRLEQVYKLCLRCETALRRELRTQNRNLKSKMLGKRLKESSLKNVSISIYHPVLSLPWKVKLVRACTVIISLLCFLGNMGSNHGNADGSTKYDAIKDVCFPSKDILYVYINMGLFTSVISSFIAGKDRISGADAGLPFLWLLLLCMHSGANEWFPSLLILVLEKVLMPLLCLFVSLLCLLQNRTIQPPRSMKKRKSFDSFSNMSSLSCDSSLCSSLADDCEASVRNDDIYAPSSNHENSGYLETASLKSFVSTNPNKPCYGYAETGSLNSLASANQKTQNYEHLETASTKSFAATNHRGLNSSFLETVPTTPKKGLFDEPLDALSLGPPSNTKRRDLGMWSSHAVKCGEITTRPVTMAMASSSMCKRTSILCPSRFNFSSPAQDSKITTSKELFSSQETTEQPNSDSSSSSSSIGSHSNQMTNSENAVNCIKQGVFSRSYIWQSLLALSASVNLVVLSYVAINYTSILGQ